MQERDINGSTIKWGQVSTFGIFSTYYIIKLSLINEKLKRGDKSENKRLVD